MTAGLLNRRIKIQYRDPNTSARMREQSKEWVDLTPDGCWAQVTAISTRDIIAADQDLPEATVRFRIRYRTDVDGKMRVWYLGKPYVIVGEPLDYRGLHEWLDIRCVHGTKAGRVPNLVEP